MRATLESLLEDQADFASMSKWIHCGNSYSKRCCSIERIERVARIADWTRIS